MKFASLFLIVFLLCSASTTNAGHIYTGLYGVWAWDDMDEAFKLLADNKFEITDDANNRTNLDKAHKRGIKGIVNFGLTREITEDEKRWQSYLNAVAKGVTAMKDHPAVFAWCPVDEPDGQLISVDKIKTLTKLIRSIDKTKPIFTVFDNPEKWSSYIPYFDIIAVDPYLRRKASGGYESVDVVNTWLKKIRTDLGKLKFSKKPVWVVLGAFSLEPKEPGATANYKKPSPEEFNQMLQMALNNKVDGIMVYSISVGKGTADYYRWDMPVNDPALWEAVKKVPLVTEPLINKAN
ncbi:MAG: hypothetical protein A2075_16640 [Geobacteraceae bacterium GWC2_58_44]|nr:MAG: hypothetical protein A2075_16640 [Geobacteraceae bacterium GWC2_58_44]HBG05041.1 hypothetical protein [Geobacter sp.]